MGTVVGAGGRYLQTCHWPRFANADCIVQLGPSGVYAGRRRALRFLGAHSGAADLPPLPSGPLFSPESVSAESTGAPQRWEVRSSHFFR